MPYDTELIEQARQVLIPVAQSEQMISYTDFASKLDEPSITARTAGGLLGAVCDFEDKNKRPMLSVVVGRSENGTVSSPGPGFFQKARELGRRFSDKDQFFINEFKQVTEYWKAHA